jgi:UDP-glucose 4-epimerase
MVLGRVGLTGSSGLLGRHICAALQASGAEVVAVSRSGAGGSTAWDLSEWKNEKALDAIFPNVRAVVHAGALIPSTSASENDQLFDINVRSCLNIAQWALTRKIPIVFISSASVYADLDKPAIKEDAPRGWNDLGGFYGMSKLLAEDMLDRFRSHGLQVAIVRPSGLYGFGGSKAKMIYRFLDSAVRGDTIVLTPPVEDSVDLVHAADLSSAIVKIIEIGCWQTFNIASGRPVSIYELASSCVDAAGSGSVEVADAIEKTVAMRRFFLDTSMAREQLGWVSTIGIQQGLGMVLAKQLNVVKG